MTPQLTLDAISKLFDQKFDQKFKEHVDPKFKNLSSEISLLKSDVTSMKGDVRTLKSDVGFLRRETSQIKTNLEKFRKQTESDFNELFDEIQKIMGSLDEGAEKKVKALQEELEPRIDKLEKHVFAS